MQNRTNIFMHKKYTTSSSVQIVALRSVDKIFPESYNFSAHKFITLDSYNSSF
jgi:hypothetical protein